MFITTAIVMVQEYSFFLEAKYCVNEDQKSLNSDYRDSYLVTYQKKKKIVSKYYIVSYIVIGHSKDEQNFGAPSTG